MFKDAVAAKVFQQLAVIPSYSGLNNLDVDGLNLNLTVVMSTRDFTQASKGKVLQNIQYSLDGKKALEFYPVHLHESIGLVSTSPSKRSQATQITVGEKRFIEVKGLDGSRTVEVTKAHGDFYVDGYYGSMTWSSDESKIMYTAQALSPEDDSKYHYIPDSGEGYTGKRTSTIVLIDLLSEVDSVTVLSNLEFFGISQPLFTSDSSSLYFIGIPTEAVQLGIKFCTNRRAALYQCDLDGKNVRKLSREGYSARFPRLSPNGKFLVYLSSAVGKPHDSCAELVKYDIISGAEEVIVPIVDVAPSNQTFPGLYTTNLKEMIWVSVGDGYVILLDSYWRSRTVILAVHLDSKAVVNLTPTGTESWSLLGTSECGQIIVTKSAPNHPSVLVYGKFDSESPIDWNVITKPPIKRETLALLQQISYSINSIPGRDSNLEVVLIKSNSKLHSFAKTGSTPLIVMPHGGPHGCTSTSFSFNIAAFCSLGFSCLVVNYTGSTGFGNDSIKKLIGRIGTLDIDDVHSAALWASKQSGIDSQNVFLHGGSHGGFITAHLLARDPGFYRAGCLRNPVINVGAMVSDSDIPDWTFGEAGIEFDSRVPKLLSPEDYVKMYGASPASQIKDKVSPALLMLGKGDRRVPPSQGLRWAEYLKGAGHDIQTLMFPNVGHALDTFEAERYGFEAGASFFIQHLRI